jgi:histidine triad (HIT) family protein
MTITNQQQQNKPCVYCSVPEIKSRLIVQNDHVWAFPTNIPITQGHTLIAPKKCIKHLSDLTKEERLAIFEMAESIMTALRKVYGAEGFNCVWNQEKLAGQSVPHFHLHIIPRKKGDTGLLGYDPRSMLYRTGDREPTDEAILIEISKSLRKVIES